MDATKRPTTTLWRQIHVLREMVDLFKGLVITTLTPTLQRLT
jgi:hypothetical protein